MTVVPIVFAFDNKYSLPAWIALRSLLDFRLPETYYDIYIMYSSLTRMNIGRINDLIEENCCNVSWIKVPAKWFEDAPKGWSGVATYYRLIVHEILRNHEKAIWSDVDVLFKRDLSEVFKMDLGEASWAGVAMERNNAEGGIHTRIEENINEYIYATGFMLLNLDRMRKTNITRTFIDAIRRYGSQLKMFDLDVLNLCCKDIKRLSLEYCVLENLCEDYRASPEYSWLKNVYSDQDIQDALENPGIIHYAGKMPKIWNRDNPSKPYLDYIQRSPYDLKLEKRIAAKRIRLLQIVGRMLELPLRVRRKLFKAGGSNAERRTRNVMDFSDAVGKLAKNVRSGRHRRKRRL